MKPSASVVREQAAREIAEEAFRQAVEAEKALLRKRRGWLKRLLSIRIIITFKE